MITFQGSWVSDDSTVVIITDSQRGFFISDSLTIKNGELMLNQDSLKINLLGLEKNLKIDKYPAQNENRGWVMVLDSTLFVKE